MFRIGERVTASDEIDKEFGDRSCYQLQKGQVGIVESISHMAKDYPIWVSWPGAKIYGNSYHVKHLRSVDIETYIKAIETLKKQ